MMPIELAGIRLERVHKISTLEKASFAYHHVPGMEGSIAQDVGRDSVHVRIEGIFYGPDATGDLDQLRQLHLTRAPMDFLAEIIGQSYFAQVVLEQFEVAQAAGDPDQFTYALTVKEYVQPPAPSSPTTTGIQGAIALEAQQFMDIATLPDLLGTIPEVTNPLPPLSGVLDDVKKATAGLQSVSDGLKAVFGIS